MSRRMGRRSIGTEHRTFKARHDPQRHKQTLHRQLRLLLRLAVRERTEATILLLTGGSTGARSKAPRRDGTGRLSLPEARFDSAMANAFANDLPIICAPVRRDVTPLSIVPAGRMRFQEHAAIHGNADPAGRARAPRAAPASTSSPSTLEVSTEFDGSTRGRGSPSQKNHSPTRLFARAPQTLVFVSRA